MNNRYFCHLLVGCPGAGKGAQGKILGTIPRFFQTVIRRRVETYESETRPVLDFYKDKLTVIDATQPPVKGVNGITIVIWNEIRASAAGVSEAATVRRFEVLVRADLVA